jgi:8-oxo-dGTP pyrophosphatase MutT (NUDIX family)
MSLAVCTQSPLITSHEENSIKRKVGQIIARSDRRELIRAYLGSERETKTSNICPAERLAQCGERKQLDVEVARSSRRPQRFGTCNGRISAYNHTMERANDSSSGKDVILAAGGILRRHSVEGDEILIVHRKRYDDWTLPKGKLQDGESFRAAALREVEEETGCVARLDGFLGVVDYIVDGTPKVVFFWQMSAVQQKEISDHEEVAAVIWMSTADAAERLTHANERAFIQWIFRRQYVSPGHIDIPPTKWYRRWFFPQKSDYYRLQREFDSFRIELALLKARSPRSDRSWAQAADDQLKEVEHYLETRRNVEGGWVCLHAARRCAAYGLSRAELVLQASLLRAEAPKLSSWRGVEMKQQLAVDDEQLSSSHIVNAMALRDEYSSNQYHKIWMLGNQLRVLLIICGLGVLLLIPLVAFFTRYPNSTISPATLGAISDWGYQMVSAVLSFGLLGAAFSAALSLINATGEIKIPERVANSFVTLTRALFGAGVGLAGYAVYHSKVFDIHIGSNMDTGPAAALAVAFLFGFAGERLIALLLGKLSESKF